MTELLDISPWVLAPAIFFARVFDVSLGTFRTIITFRGYGLLALAVGFVEAIVWVIAISQVIANLEHWALILAYAGGFACGNLAGIWLERRIAIGNELVRVITHSEPGVMAQALRQGGHEVVNIVGNAGREDNAELLFVEEQRRRVPLLLTAVRRVDPEAVVSITDLKRVDDPMVRTRRVHFIPAGWRGIGRRK